MESANGLQFNHCPLNHCPLLHGFAHLSVHSILKLHSGTAVTGRVLNLGGGGRVYILLHYRFQGRGGGIYILINITSVTFCIPNDAICLPNFIAIGAGVIAL